jgi:hypothetical protein
VPPATMAKLAATRTVLKSVLSYHVLPDKLSAPT